MESYSTRARRFNTEDIEKRRKKKASATRKKYGTVNYDCPTKKSIICSEEDRPRAVLLFGGRLGGGVGVFLGEALDAACGVYQLLLAGEERVAI